MPEIAAKLVTSAVDSVVKRADRTGGKVVMDQAVKESFGKDALSKVGKAAKTMAADATPVIELPKVKVAQPLDFVVSAGTKIDAPRLSPDKKSVTYVVRETKDIPTIMKKMLGLPTNEPTERMTAWVAPVDGSAAPQKVAGRTFHNVVEPAFSPDGKSVIYCQQKNIPFLAYGEKLKQMRLDQVELATGKVKTIYDGDLTMLHPQYSPDGSKIAAYSRDKGANGIYLLDAKNPGSDPVRLTMGDDKHPVWTNDGKRIYFHNQKGGDALSGAGDSAEQAWLGYVDLTDPKNPKRVMLDDTKAESYHKHPTPIANSNLIVYHNDDHKLEVMDTVTGQRGRLNLSGTSPNGSELKKFKHVASSTDGEDMVMVAQGGKQAVDRGIPEHWRVYLLQNAAQIKDAFTKTFAGQ